MAMDPSELKQSKKASRPRLNQALVNRARSAIDNLDEQGRWIEDGRMRDDDRDGPKRRVISSQTFINNVKTLCRYLTAAR